MIRRPRVPRKPFVVTGVFSMVGDPAPVVMLTAGTADFRGNQPDHTIDSAAVARHARANPEVPTPSDLSAATFDRMGNVVSTNLVRNTPQPTNIINPRPAIESEVDALNRRLDEVLAIHETSK
jgi:hypothetical protein